jgi:hypothetical protein
MDQMTDRLTELLAQKATAEADGGEAGPELLGQIGWHKGDFPSKRHDYDSSLPSTEQCDAWQLYFDGYAAEARRSMGVDR